MAARLPEHRLGWDANSQWITFAHSHEKATSLFLLCGVCLEWGKCDCISSCNRKKDEWLPLVQWIWHVMLMIQRKVYSMCTHAHLNIHEQQTHTQNMNKLFVCRKIKSASAFMCIIHGGCWAASNPLPQHSTGPVLMTAAPPSLSSCLLAVRKKITYPSFSSFYFHRIKTIYSPLLGISVLLCLRSWMYFQVPCLFPAPSLSMEMLSLQTAHSFHHFEVTWSGPLPNKGDHLL